MANLRTEKKLVKTSPREITLAEIETLTRDDPGSFAIYRLTSSQTAETLFYSPDRPAFCGYTKEEYETLSREASSFIVPEDIPFVENALRRLLDTGEDAMINYRIKQKDLGFVWLHTVYRLIGLLDGRPILFASFLNDSAETQLFTELLNNVKTMIFVIDSSSHKMLYSNRAGQEYSHKNVDYSAFNCFEYIRDQKSLCSQCFFAGLKEGESRHQEFFHPATKIWQSINVERVDWCGHDAVVETIEDITDYKAQQKLLQAQKSELENIIASIPVGISVYRKVGNTITRIFLNDDVSRIKGVLQEQLMKDSFADIFKRVWPEDKKRVIDDTVAVFTKGHTLCVYRTRNEKTGRYMWLRREGRSRPQVDGSVLAYFSYVDISAQIEGEEALRESRDRYNRAVEGGHIAVWEYDLERDEFYSPQNSLMLLGIPDRLGHIPDSLYRYFAPNSYPDIKEQIDALKAGRVPPTKDLWTQTVNGVSRCYQVTYTLIFDSDKHPIKGYGVAQDITFQKSLEEEYEHLSQDFLLLNPDALCSFRLNLSTDRCYGGHGSSQYIKRILASDTADGFFKALMGLMVEEDDLKAAKAIMSRSALIASFYAGKKNLSLTYRRRMENGQYHWVTTSIALIQNPHTQEIEALLYSLDSNEAVTNKLISERLTEENYEFTALIDVKSGKIVFHDLPSDSATTPHQSDNFDDDFAEAADILLTAPNAAKMKAMVNLAHIREELKKAPKYSYTFTIEKGEGKGEVKSLSFLYLEPSQSEILLARSDISLAMEEEKKQAATLARALEEAEKANQLKTDFLSNVSHDMRTPLNGVIGYTEMALESEDPSAIKDYLKKIKKSGELLMSLINDTLDLSKIENGQTSLQKTPADLSELFQKISTSVAPSIAERKLNFTCVLTPEKPAEVSIDVLKVTEIVNNLLSNAIKFTPEGGSVKLLLDASKETPNQLLCDIVVEDTGIGMSQSFQSKAFEPFSQEKTEKNADVMGSGLGLSIVNQLVHLMGGDIRLNSALGRGTRFEIRVPFEKSTAPLPHASTPLGDVTCLRGKKILLVEDNRMNAEIARNILTRYGMSVANAGNGLEAVKGFNGALPFTYAAILMDIRMPIMNGFEAAEAIRSSTKEDAKSVPIIAMTADAYEDDVKRCLDAGMNAHISKPINRELLLQELVRFLKK